MSVHPAGDNIHDEAAPIEPPTRHPLAPFRVLVKPGIIAVLAICGVVFGFIPLWNMMATSSKNLQKITRDSARIYTYQVPPPPQPVYVPGNNPNGPFTPGIP
jgi:hypothetical protein